MEKDDYDWREDRKKHAESYQKHVGKDFAGILSDVIGLFFHLLSGQNEAAVRVIDDSELLKKALGLDEDSGMPENEGALRHSQVEHLRSLVCLVAPGTQSTTVRRAMDAAE